MIYHVLLNESKNNNHIMFILPVECQNKLIDWLFTYNIHNILSPVIEQFRFNKIALFSFSVDLGWSTCVKARIQNLPQSALGKLPNFTKIQDGQHYSIQNH